MEKIKVWVVLQIYLAAMENLKSADEAKPTSTVEMRSRTQVFGVYRDKKQAQYIFQYLNETEGGGYTVLESWLE